MDFLLKLFEIWFVVYDRFWVLLGGKDGKKMTVLNFLLSIIFYLSKVNGGYKIRKGNFIKYAPSYGNCKKKKKNASFKICLKNML